MHWFIYIKDSPTLLASKVIVVLGITIEPAFAVGKVQLQDLLLQLQQFQVAVNCPEADVGYFLPHLLVDLLSSGMGVWFSQDFKDSLSLF